MSAGIDYGMGTTNVDKSNGIRFGVISSHDISQALSDSDIDYIYPGPNCPKCGCDVVSCDDSMQENEGYRRDAGSCDDFQCDDCEHVWDSSQVYGEEPTCWEYREDGYELSDCLDSDVFVTKSPYYTLAQYCSPCVPGACSLNSPDEDGVKAYCLGHDWFEDCKAPYTVYSVATGAIVEPEVRS